jgi:hypothetical protein
MRSALLPTARSQHSDRRTPFVTTLEVVGVGEGAVTVTAVTLIVALQNPRSKGGKMKPGRNLTPKWPHVNTQPQPAAMQTFYNWCPKTGFTPFFSHWWRCSLGCMNFFEKKNGKKPVHRSSLG